MLEKLITSPIFLVNFVSFYFIGMAIADGLMDAFQKLSISRMLVIVPVALPCLSMLFYWHLWELDGYKNFQQYLGSFIGALSGYMAMRLTWTSSK